MSEVNPQTPARIRSTSAVTPQISSESVNNLVSLVGSKKKKRVVADVTTVQNLDGSLNIQMDNIEKKKSLSNRAVTVLRTTEMGEAVAAAGSVAFGIYSILTGNAAAGYPSIAGGAGVLWKLVESKVVDWFKK
ncbi:MAG: hypothetical protein LBB16_01580 [Puniceicoccales bacterium]|jgi:hypothetical protein|nr:hypothetical protein [Puniceicoccales bacterium]